MLLKSAQIVAAPWGAVVEENLLVWRETMAALFDLHAKRMIRPLVSRRFPLARAAEALQLLQAREAVGKIVVFPG